MQTDADNPLVMNQKSTLPLMSTKILSSVYWVFRANVLMLQMNLRPSRIILKDKHQFSPQGMKDTKG